MNTRKLSIEEIENVNGGGLIHLLDVGCSTVGVVTTVCPATALTGIGAFAWSFCFVYGIERSLNYIE